MKKMIRNIQTVKKLLIKLHSRIAQNEIELGNQINRSDTNNLDPRITSFGYQRMIVFCAINDCDNLIHNLEENQYLNVAGNLQGGDKEEILIEAIRNYPLYNFIIRYYSIIETSTRSFLNNSDFREYNQNLPEQIRIAGEVLRTWRNTIHKNGLLDDEIKFNYRGKEIIISNEHQFEFDLWTLYRICTDCTDLVKEMALMQVQNKSQNNDN
jgi:hypothetical protein